MRKAGVYEFDKYEMSRIMNQDIAVGICIYLHVCVSEVLYAGL